MHESHRKRESKPYFLCLHAFSLVACRWLLHWFYLFWYTHVMQGRIKRMLWTFGFRPFYYTGLQPAERSQCERLMISFSRELHLKSLCMCIFAHTYCYWFICKVFDVFVYTLISVDVVSDLFVTSSRHLCCCICITSSL